MHDPSNPFADIVEKDSRYAPAAYFFVFEALRYAQQELEMGSTREGEEHHVTGKELCEAVRQLALEQFGYMAKCVLNSWGVQSTSDIGVIVFNLIEAEQMKKTPHDRREDFDDVFDFESDLQQNFKITLPE